MFKTFLVFACLFGIVIGYQCYRFEGDKAQFTNEKKCDGERCLTVVDNDFFSTFCVKAVRCLPDRLNQSRKVLMYQNKNLTENFTLTCCEGDLCNRGKEVFETKLNSSHSEWMTSPYIVFVLFIGCFMF